LLVRASLADLDIVEQAMQVLNEAPPQVTIDVKFAEVSQEDIKGVGFDWFLGNFRFGNSGVVGSGGTQPSLNGLGPSGLPNTFPGVPGSAGGQIGNAVFPAAASTLIPNRASDGLVSSSLRNLAGNGGNIPEVATITGILTDPQFRVVIRAMEQRGGVDLLSAPRVTTLSGRQTQIAIVDLVTVVAGVNLNQQAGGGAQNQVGGANTGVIGTTANYNTAALPFGPVLDVVPYVAADGYTIHMTIIPTLTEFLGYDDPGAFVPTAQGAAGNNIGTPVTAQLPLPRLRSHVLATSATVWDGQTIVLGGLITEDVQKFKDKVPVLGDLPVLGRMFRSESRFARKKNLVIFVSPTIIDPAGNRVHTDDELPFAKSAIPPQAPTQN
jgi:general secretion pathway protein D